MRPQVQILLAPPVRRPPAGYGWGSSTSRALPIRRLRGIARAAPERTFGKARATTEQPGPENGPGVRRARRGPTLRAGQGDASGMRGATAEGCAPPPHPGRGGSSRSCRPGCQRLPGTAVTQACRHSGCAYRACTALTPVPGTPVPHGLVRGPPVTSLVLLERAGASATLEPECEEAFEEEAVFARSVGQEDARPSSRNPRSIRPGASPGSSCPSGGVRAVCGGRE